MRAVATALVLIAGAAVILWYGSTLNNSWVLGGLIGGFAALLLSIPISLTLFSHLSRRHDERLRMEEQDEEIVHLARSYNYPAVPARRSNEVEADGYTIDEVDEEDDDEDWQERQERYEARRRALRRLPAPAVDIQQTQRAGYPGQRQATNGDSRDNRLPAPRQQVQQNSPQQTQQAKTQRRDTKVLRSASLNTLSQHRMDALRAARREAIEARQASDSDIEVSPTQYSRQQRMTRASQSLKNNDGYETYEHDERNGMRKEPHTDYIDIDKQLSRTASLRRTPQTEQVERRVRTRDLDPDRQPSASWNAETENIRINKPLVRRAPYMYEDDEMRQQLLQQLDPPAVRRSSRQEVWQEDDDV